MRPLLTIVFGVVLLAGCDSSGLGRIVPVRGRVTLDGAPLASGSLVFKPDASKGNASKFEPSATIQPDGSYSLFTKEKEGAPLGWYQVGVVAQSPPPANDPYAAPKSLIPTRYGEAETSGISVEVVANPPASSYDIRLAK